LSGLSSKKAERTEEKSTEQLAEIAQNQALIGDVFAVETDQSSSPLCLYPQTNIE